MLTFVMCLVIVGGAIAGVVRVLDLGQLAARTPHDQPATRPRLRRRDRPAAPAPSPVAAAVAVELAPSPVEPVAAAVAVEPAPSPVAAAVAVEPAAPDTRNCQVRYRPRGEPGNCVEGAPMVAPEPMAVAVEPVAVQPVALPASAVDDRPRGRAAGAVGLVAFVTVLGIGVAGLFGGALLLLDVALRQAAK